MLGRRVAGSWIALALGCQEVPPQQGEGTGAAWSEHAKVAEDAAGRGAVAHSSYPTKDGGEEAFVVTVAASSGSVCPGECVELSVRVDGGQAPYRFAWDHGLGEGAHVGAVCPTETTRYTVTVEDAARDDEFTRDPAKVSASLSIRVDPERACRDAGVSDATPPVRDTRELCVLRGHVTGGAFTADQAQKHHQSLVDGHGDLVLIGSFSGTLDVGGATLGAEGSLAGLVAKVDANCRLVWAKAFTGEANSWVSIAALARDAGDNLYLGGSFSGTTQLGESTMQSGVGIAGFVMKLDPDGNEVWRKVYTSRTAAVAVVDLVTDAQRRLTLIGYAGADTSLGGAPLGFLYAASMPFLAQLDTDGRFVWSRTFTSPDLLYGLSNGPDGDTVILTGWGSERVDLGAGALALDGGGRFLAKLDPLGRAQWLRALPRGAEVDQWNWWKGGVAVDTGGGIVVLRDEPQTLPGDSGARVLDDSVEKYTPDGAPVWQTRLSPASAFDAPWGASLALFGDDHALRFGSFRGATEYAGTRVVSRGGSDVALVELGPEGEALWAYALGGEHDDLALGVAVDSDGHMFASYTSSTDATGASADLVVVKLRRR
jgi:hypothetical protein